MVVESVKVGFAQMKIVFGDLNKNIQTIEKLVKKAAGTDLLVFPELCITGYVFDDKTQLLTYAEPLAGYTMNKMIQLSEQYNTYIVYGLPELLGKQIFNTVVLVGPKGFIGSYQKSHLFNKERLLFDYGQTGYTVYQTPIGKIGLANCLDYIYPEAARTLALQGAQIVCYPSNLKTMPDKVNTCLRATAFQNRLYTIMTNRVGKEKGVQFLGGSEIVGPDMTILAQGKYNQQDIKIVQVNLAYADDKIYTKDINTGMIYNDLLSDRRTDLYQL